MNTYTVVYCAYGETGNPKIGYAKASTPEMAEHSVLKIACKCDDKEILDYDTIAVFKGNLRDARYID